MDAARDSDAPSILPKFLVVGLGASAGGVEALHEFFAHVPPDSGMAYVVILHLSPDYDSQLAAILQTAAPIPVTKVTAQTTIEPNRVYVVPPNQHLEMDDGMLDVLSNVRLEERRAPIDIFFRSLAESHGPRAVAVVLSGTGANGSMGIKRVKECGGAVFVQAPSGAIFNEMPRNAIATGLVDDVLPVAVLPARIAAYSKGLSAVTIPEDAGQRFAVQQEALREVFAQLRERTGHDFSNYKPDTVLRRIERRISVWGLPDLQAYAAYLREHPDETQALLKDLLLPVTSFFRDEGAFVALDDTVLSQLLRDKNADNTVRVWVVGCATGEEAYSLAMLLAERTLGILDAPQVKIFASDIDETAIARARTGLYTLNEAVGVSPERLRRFFTIDGHCYRVRHEIRDLIVFVVHNVLKDPPFGYLDLICCRNVLTYLNQPAQERALETFHFALNPGGYLFLGTTETADGVTDLFAPISQEQGLFQSRQTSVRSHPGPVSLTALHVTPDIAQLRGLERATSTDLHPQYKVQAEELSAANEELQRMNEELRSWAEELQTSKEELRTLNQELTVRIIETVLARNNLQNLVNSTNTGTLFLDRGFRVVLFTPAARTIFNLIRADSGRLLSDITHRLAGVDVIADAETVLRELQPIEREAQTTDGRTFLMRVLPYRTADDRIQGVVVTFTDITELKRAEDTLRVREERFRAIIESGVEGVLLIGPDERIQYVSPAITTILGYTPDEFCNLGLQGVIHSDDLPYLGQLLATASAAPNAASRAAIRLRHRDGRWRWVEWDAVNRLDNPAVQAMIVNFRDVNERVEALQLEASRQRLQELSVRLLNAQEEERRALAYELHDEIGQRLTGLHMALEIEPSEVAADDLRGSLREAQQLVRDLIGQVRQRSLDLRPPLLDELGLLATLRWHIEGYMNQTGVAVDFKYGELDDPLPPHIAIAAYRIVQEGLTNIARHAHTNQASVQVWTSAGQLKLAIEDQGCGFDSDAASHALRSVGLAGMRDRVRLLGGQFSIESAPNEGTHIFVTLPLSLSTAP